MGSLIDTILSGLAALLAACYSLTGDYALAIAVFTLAIMLVFTPLTLKSTRSMMAMQQLQPELKALQNKYRDDRQTLNTEMMALYQRHGVNPLGGCLPMLVQIPIFFMLFALLRGLTRRNSDGTEFNPKYLDESSQLFKDLSTAGGEMMSFGIDLARQANEVVQDDLVTSVPYVAMVVVTGLTSWYQQRQMAARRTPGVEIPQQQQMLMKILPWTLPIFAFFMPAGLVVYFIVSNLWRVGQQAYISRRIHQPAAELTTTTPVETEAVEPSRPNPRNKGGKGAGAKGGPPAKGGARGRSNGSGDSSGSAGSKREGSGSAPKGPRPKPRPRTRPPASPAGPAAKERSRRGGQSQQQSGPRKPPPTSRTAGHGPAKRPANKRKKR